VRKHHELVKNEYPSHEKVLDCSDIQCNGHFSHISGIALQYSDIYATNSGNQQAGFSYIAGLHQ
jgi:hypothetical protein